MEIAKPKILFWTKHSKEKMRFYNLSESRVKRVLRMPTRTEEGIAPETIAMMQSAGTPKNPYEIWVMTQSAELRRADAESCGKEIKIISAWKYPGKTKPRSEALLRILNSEYGECES